MTYREYLKKISNTETIQELKEIGKAIYNDENLLIHQKKELFNVYRGALRELYYNKVKSSENKIFTSLYWLVRKHPCPECGQLIFALKDQKVLDKEELDILFNEYRKRTHTDTPIEDTQETEEDIPF